jgi:excisionase family DNA binding protein
MDRLLTVEEVAQRLRLHQITVRRHIKSGRLSATHVGRRVRIREEDVESFASPTKRPTDMTPEKMREKLLAPPSLEEVERRRRWAEEIPALQQPIDIKTATLVRVGRRMNEVLYGEKTLQQLIDEES